MKKNNINQGWWLDPLVIVILLLIFYGLWLGSYPLFTPDEGRYCEIAREMIASGDYITPHLNGIVFLDKPILYYWLQVFAIKLFGLKEWALRFWPACMGILGCLIIYITGRMVYDRRTGILSAAILATTPLYFGASHYANLDLEVSLFITGSLAFFLIFTKRAQTLFIILAYCFAALAMLTKGLIGIAFPAMIIGTWIILLNRWSILKSMHLFLGAGIFVVIALPWYLLVQKANPQFFNYFFVLQQFSRFLTKGDFNNQTLWWFYIPIVLLGFFPWSSFVIQSFFQQIKSILEDKQKHASELFVILWFTIILLFFSIPQSKTIGYILPVFPALSLIVGRYLNLHLQKRNGILLLIAANLIFAALFFSNLGIRLLDLNPSMQPYMMLGGMILFFSSMLLYFLKKPNMIFCCIAFTSTLFLLCILNSASIINYKSIKPIAQLINEEIKPNDEVVTFHRYYQDLPVYLQRKIIVVDDWNKSDIAKNDNWKRELWYYKNSSSSLISNTELFQLWMSDKRLFLLIKRYAYYSFKNTLHDYTHGLAKVYILGSYSFNDKETILLVSNENS